MINNSIKIHDNKSKLSWPWALNDSRVSDINLIDFPKISIITPSFNQGEFIEETIRSIIFQNYPNLEYIIVDGGSTDNTLEIINKYKNFIDIVISEPDHGQSDAINKGWKIASGHITTWINSDDYLAPNCLFDVAKHASNLTDNFLIVGNVLNFVNNTNEYYVVEQKNINYDNLLRFWEKKCVWHQPGIFFSMNLIRKKNYLNLNYHYSMDYDLLCKILPETNVFYSKNIFTYFRLHDFSKGISSPQKTINEKISICEFYWKKNKKLFFRDLFSFSNWFLKYFIKSLYYRNYQFDFTSYFNLIKKIIK